MVQDILSDLESDDVNSISDTEEAMQVATSIKNTYIYLVETFDIPFENKLFSLVALGDTDTPSHMKFPTIMRKIEWLKYNKEEVSGEARYRMIKYLSPEDFHNMVMSRVETDTNVISVTDVSGIQLLIRNDKQPDYWTTFDDEYVVFDSYDSSIDSTLQQSKSSCYGSLEKTFTMSDSFVPELPSKYFSMLYEEAKAQCFADLAEGNPRAERRSRRQQIKMQGSKAREDKQTGYYAQGRPRR